MNLGATEIGGVRLGASEVSKIYLGASEVWANLGPIYNVAFVGDSITDAGSSSLFVIQARGFAGWAQVFNRQKWNITPNTGASRYQWATSGASTATIVSNHMSSVLASGADTVVWHSGQNDRGSGGLTAAQAATNMRAVWAQIRAAGKRPIATTLCGVTTAGGATQQAWNVEFNGYIRSHAAADGVLLCDWAHVLSASGTDDGILDPAYAIDSIHPNSTGASRMGRVLAATLAPLLDETVDPFSGLTNASPNPTWTGGPAPSSWFQFPGSGNTMGTQSFEAATDPSKWWRLPHTQGGVNSSNVITFDDAITSYNGVQFAALVELEVISGALTMVDLVQNMQNGGTVARCINQVDGATLGSQVTAADGRIVLRTPRTPGTSGTNLAYPELRYAGTANLRIRRLATWY